jgi:hypothetical protein
MLERGGSLDAGHGGGMVLAPRWFVVSGASMVVAVVRSRRRPAVVEVLNPSHPSRTLPIRQQQATFPENPLKWECKYYMKPPKRIAINNRDPNIYV